MKMKRNIRRLIFLFDIIGLSQANAWPPEELTLDDVKELQSKGILLRANYNKNQTLSPLIKLTPHTRKSRDLTLKRNKA